MWSRRRYELRHSGRSSVEKHSYNILAPYSDTMGIARLEQDDPLRGNAVAAERQREQPFRPDQVSAAQIWAKIPRV